MSGQVLRCSPGDYQADERTGVAGLNGDYQADEQAGVAGLSWLLSIRRAGRCREAKLATIKQMSGQVSRGSTGDYQADERQVLRGSPGDYQADERTGFAGLSWRLSSR